MFFIITLKMFSCNIIHNVLFTRLQLALFYTYIINYLKYKNYNKYIYTILIIN